MGPNDTAMEWPEPSLPESLSVPDCPPLAVFLHLILCMLLASPTAYPT